MVVYPARDRTIRDLIGLYLTVDSEASVGFAARIYLKYRGDNEGLFERLKSECGEFSLTDRRFRQIRRLIDNHILSGGVLRPFPALRRVR